MVDVGSAVGYLDLDISKFLANLQTANSKVESVSKNMEAKFSQTSDKLTAMGSKMSVAVTAPIKAAEGYFVKTAADFEAQMSKVSAISGATGDDLDALTDKAKEMGKQTKFSASESAQAFQYMAMAGWKTEDMLQGIDGIMSLSAADGLDLATTSDIVTDALTAFGLKAGDAGHFADVLAQSSRNANTNVSMLGESFKYIAPVAGAMGYSVEDISLALGTMANSGIKGSQAGTALRSALSRLVNPTDKIADALAKYNLVQTEMVKTIDSEKLEKAQTQYEKRMISQYQAQVKYNEAVEKYGEASSQAQVAGAKLYSENKALEKALQDLQKEQEGSKMQMVQTGDLLTDQDGKMRSLREVLEIFRENMRGLTKDEQAQAASIIFGQEAMSGMLSIINASDEDFEKLANAIDNSDGVAKEMADTMNDNFKGQLTLLKSQIEGIAITLGELLLPSMKKLVERVSQLATWFEGLSTSQQMTILKIAALVSAIGPLLIVIGKLIKLVNTFVRIARVVKTVIMAINSALLANPIAIVIAAIAALVAAFIYFYKTNEEFRDKVNAAWNEIKDVFQVVANKIQDIWKKLCNFFGPIFSRAMEIVKSAINAIISAFRSLVNFVLPYIQLIGEKIQALWDFIVSTFLAMIESLKPLIKEMIGAFQEAWEVIKVIWDMVVPYFKEIWAGIKQTFSAVADTLGEFFEAAWEKIKDVWDSAKPYFKAIWEAIKLVFSVVAVVLKGFFQAAWLAIKIVWDVAIKYFTAVWAGIRAVFAVVKGVLSGDFSDAWDAIKNVWNRVVDFFAAIWNGIKQVFAMIDGWFGGIFSSAWQSVKNAWSAAVGFFQGIWNGITNVFSSVGGFFRRVFKEAYDAIKGVFNSLKSFFEGFWDSIKGTFTEIGEKIGDTVGEAFKSVINSVLELIEDKINGAIDLINGALHIINKIPGVEIDDISGVEFPGLAKGGIVNRPMIAQIGEQGREAVIPLENNLQWVKKVADRISESLIVDISPLVNIMQKMLEVSKVAKTVEPVPLESNRKPKPKDDNWGNENGGPPRNGDTYIFNSPKRIDEKEAARQIKRVKKDLIEGF